MPKKPRPLKERFEEKFKINEETGCWEWQGSLNNCGYGFFAIKSGFQKTAHRASFELYIGTIPDKMKVCHECDNTLCVNPNHLFLGTQQDNMDDMYKKGRRKKAVHPSITAYQRGCRCVECKNLAKIYMKQYKASKK